MVQEKLMSCMIRDTKSFVSSVILHFKDIWNMKKRSVSLILTCLLAFLLAGCGPAEESGPAETEGSSGAKTPVTMLYFLDLPNFEALVEKTYPDIDLQIERNAEATIDGESERRLRTGHGSDIITTTMPTGDVKQYALDLSAQKFASAYQAGISQSLLIDGKTLFLPLPGQYYGYIYNATLAAQAGVTEAPTSTGALLSMLDAASAHGLGIGSDDVMFALESNDMTNVSSYFIGTQVPDFLGQSEGVIWRENLTRREDTFSDGMTDCLSLSSAMVEKGYLDPARLNNKEGNMTPAMERMQNGTLLLSYGSVHFLDMLNAESDQYEFAMFPFLSEGNNHPWTIAAPAAFLGLNAALAESGKEDVLNAAKRVLDLLSTPEGQAAFIQDSGAAQSYLAAEVPTPNEISEGLVDCVAEGYVYNIQFPAKLLQYFGRSMVSVLNGEIVLKDALANVDHYFLEGDEEIEYDQTLIGVVAEDMIYENYNVRREETAIGNLVADAIREMTEVDVAFVNGGSIRGSLYKGNVFGGDLDVICPYDNTIVVLEVKGSVIREMLENGLTHIVQENGIPGGRFLNVSGLCYSYRAPAGDSPAKLLKITLPDGASFDESGTYTIAVTSYMCGANGYLDNNGDGFTMLNVYSNTAPMAEGVTLVKETGKTFGDALQLYFQSHNGEAILAKPEGRIKEVIGDD